MSSLNISYLNSSKIDKRFNTSLIGNAATLHDQVTDLDIRF